MYAPDVHDCTDDVTRHRGVTERRRPRPRDIDPTRYVYIPGLCEVSDIDLDKEVVYGRDGRHVTQAMLAAEEAEMPARHEALYKLHPGLRPGGKSLSGDGSISPRFQIRLDRVTAARAKARATAEGKSPAKLLREIVTAELRKAA